MLWLSADEGFDERHVEGTQVRVCMEVCKFNMPVSTCLFSQSSQPVSASFFLSLRVSDPFLLLSHDHSHEHQNHQLYFCLLVCHDSSISIVYLAVILWPLCPEVLGRTSV